MNTLFSRRNFMNLAAILAAGSSADNAFASSERFPGFSNPGNSGWKPFMNQYFDGIMKIINGIRDTQVDNICGAMEIAYKRKMKGGKIHSYVVFGHYSWFAGCADIPGQPDILPQGDILITKEDMDAMRPGDFLITDIVNKEMIDVRNRGVYVTGVTNNYYKFSETPAGFLNPERRDVALEEISDLIIDSQVPWYNGLVNAPQIPQFRLCPSTGISQYLVYWSCTAALATLIGNKGKGDPAQAVRNYLDLTIDRFKRIHTDLPKVDSIGKEWADLVLEKGSRIFVYGEQFKGARSSGNMFTCDAVGAASGAMICQHYDGKLRENDIVLIGSVRSAEPGEMKVARDAKKAGAHTYAFCPFSTDGDSSGERLYKEVDVAFNTYSPESEGVLEVPGFDKKICPIAGITGNLVQWLLTAQWTDHMARRGEMPYYWMGWHENGGMEYDNLVRPYFMKRGY